MNVISLTFFDVAYTPNQHFKAIQMKILEVKLFCEIMLVNFSIEAKVTCHDINKISHSSKLILRFEFHYVIHISS